MNELDIFSAALEIKDPDERAAFLARECGRDNELRQRIQELLESHVQVGSFMDAPAPAEFSATVTPAPLSEKPGTVIGPYKLLQQIGEGGFGVVYMAEQTEPVRRKVALKIIKPGMDTREVIARFEAERQALALMDHPNIAKVLDAGATESGRPYFVMELVKGVPLTEYCDRNHLSTRDRLGLFVSVCNAIQHAHQKGVIHRDLKPSNIMITLHDGKPVPKVIDFGVSKALSQQLTEKTLFTAYGQMVGTPAYMSPEQAEMSGLDIDTRSDVYSLGVLLYELLTGSTPFDSRRLRDAGYAEMQRIIREEEPVRPSTRLTTMGEESTVVSSNRGTDPKKLGQLVRGDLDWIVMKALDKERNRRYETANGFAADIERFLADEPVEACPPSAAYRFRKFARRNKAQFAVTSAALLVLVAVAIGSSIAAGRFRALARDNADLADHNADLAEEARESEATARTAQADAEDARDREAELRIDSEQQRERAEANFSLALSAVDEFLNQVTENELLTVPGMQPLREELLSSAMTFYEDFAQDEANASEMLVELASAHYRIARIRSELGQADESATSNDRSIELFEQLRESGNHSLEVRLGLARAYFRAGQYDDTVLLCREIREDDPQDAETRSLLGDTYNTLALDDKNDDDIPAALAYHRQALALRESLVQDFPDNADYLAELGGTLNNLGVLLNRQGQDREALALFERGNQYKAEAYDKSPQTILWGRWLCDGLRNVALTQASFGEQDEALRAYQRAVAIRRKLAFDNPAVPSLKGELFKAWYDLGNHQQTLGFASEASRSFRRAEEVLENIDTNTPSDLFNLAIVYGALATPPEGAADEPDEEARAEMQHFADLAMETIDRAVLEGYRDLNMLKTHKYLAVVRERGKFQQLIAWLETDVLVSTGDAAASEESLAELRDALTALQELIGDDPTDVRHRRTLAATLHSVALIERGLENYEAAEEALAEELTIREALQRDEPENAQYRVDLGSVSIALGDVSWKSSRFPQAREHWDTGLELLESAVALAPGDVALEADVANQELTIFRRYGEAGLWEWAAEYCERVLERGSSYDGHWDPRFIHLLASMGRLDDHAELLGLLAEKWSETDPDKVLWAAAMSPQEVLVPATLVDLAERSIESTKDPARLFRAASAFFRASQYERALELMSGKPRDFIGPNYRFWYALVDHKLGDKEQAEHMLEQGEIAYRDIALRCLQGPAATGVLDGHHGYWYAWAEDQAIRRQAWNEIRGHEPPDDPWQHLIQARAYQTIGETELAEAELAAATAAAPADVDVRLARIQLLEDWGETDRIETEWEQVVNRVGDDPMPWIQRGRWYSEQGEHEKADVDFARAASLTPNELNRFLEAGWWVVGPYPANLAVFCPPELNPDPSQPVYTIDPKTGLSDEPVRWSSILSGAEGLIRSPDSTQSDAGSYYAIAYVYSDHECCTLLRVSSGSDFRLWVNGKSVSQSARTMTRIPLALRAGRNTILLKCAGDCRVSLGDSPLDRALTFVEQGRWTDAASLVRELRISDLDQQSVSHHLAIAVAAAGDEQAYNALAANLIERAGADFALFGVCQRPNPAFAEHVETLVKLANDFARNPPNLDAILLAALVNYRAGRLDRAQDFLDQVPKDTHTYPCTLPIRALVASKQGKAGLADSFLRDALICFESITDDAGVLLPGRKRGSFDWPYEPAQLSTLLCEAEREILGTDVEMLARLDEFESRQREFWEQRDPADKLFDLAVHTEILSPAIRYLARGRRLAELGRFDEAEADFNQAVRVVPDDPEVRVARATFFADRGNAQRAAAEFHEALKLLADTRWPLGVPIDVEVARREEVFDRLVTLRPHDHHLWWARVFVLVAEGEHDEAAAALQDTSFGGEFSNYVGAILATLRGDQEESKRLREEHSSDNSYRNTIRLGLAPTDEATTVQLLAASERMLRQRDDRWSRLFAAVAMYRAGDLEAALDLESALTTSAVWPDDGVAYPVLAMIHHRLGNSEAARRWLEKSAFWLQQHALGTVRPDSNILSGNNIVPCDWMLIAMVYYREAKTLIDGEEREFASIVDATPHERSVLQLYGDAIRHVDAGEEEQAVALLSEAIDRAPGSRELLLMRAEVYRRLGKTVQAEADDNAALNPLRKKAQAAIDAARESTSRDESVDQLLSARDSPDVLHVWNFAGGDEAWNQTHQCLLDRSEGVLTVTATGKDPYFATTLWAPAGWKELTICARVSGDLYSDLFWATAEAREFGGGNVVGFLMGDSGGEWRMYRVYFHPNADLTRLRLDPFDLRHNPDSSSVPVDIAWMTLANRSLDDAIESHPDDADLFAMRADNYRQQKEWELADADYTQALALRPDAKWFQHRGFIRRWRMRRYESAIDNYSEAIQSGFDEEWAFYGRARTCLDLGRFEQAIADCTTAIELGPVRPQHYSRRSWAYLDSGDLENALADAEHLISMNPESSLGHHGKACVYVAEENWELLRETSDRILELEPDHEQWKEWYSDLLLHRAQGDREQVAQVVGNLLEEHGDSDDPEILNGLAICLRIGADTLTDREPFVRVANRAYPDRQDAYGNFQIAVSLYYSDRYQETVDLLNQVEETGWEYPAVSRLYLAMAHHQLGHHDEARRWWDRADEELTHPAARYFWTHWWAFRLEAKLLHRQAANLLGVQSDDATGEPVAASPSTGS